MPNASPLQPRARGLVTVAARLRGDVTALGDLRQQGSSRMLFAGAPGPRLTGITLNTAGGITGGDRFRLDAHAGTGAHLTLTTQAAERAYRAQPGEIGQIRVSLTLQARARLDWLPQETILFDGCNLDRHLDVRMAADATLLLVEPLIFGRIARGEELRAARLRDRLRVTRDGTLIFADTLHLSGDIAAHLDRPGVAAGGRATAAILLAAPGAERHLTAARALIARTGGVSAPRAGLLFARLIAADGMDLRATLIPLLTLLGGPLPRTWML